MGIREGKFMNTKAKAKISELLVILGTCLFAGGAMRYPRGALQAEHISGIGAPALIFVGAGAGTTKAEQ
jgi:predicted alpha/beta-hydrolase family hydrolase